MSTSESAQVTDATDDALTRAEQFVVTIRRVFVWSCVFVLFYWLGFRDSVILVLVFSMALKQRRHAELETKVDALVELVHNMLRDDGEAA